MEDINEKFLSSCVEEFLFAPILCYLGQDLCAEILRSNTLAVKVFLSLHR